MTPENKFLVIGDTCLDHYVFGTAIKMCPEAPVGVLRIENEDIRGGMAENVLNNLISLGGCPKSNYEIYCSDCANKKTRYVDKASNYIMLRVDSDCKNASKFDKETFVRLVEKIKPNLIYLADYCKGFLSEQDIQFIAEYCTNNVIVTVLDTKKKINSWAIEIDYVKINKKEYEYQLEQGISHPEANCGELIVTRASEGTWWVNKDIVIPTQVVSVSDLTGAGDVFGAAFSVYLMEGNTVEKSIEFANKAASFSVTKQGVVAVKREEIT